MQTIWDLFLAVMVIGVPLLIIWLLDRRAKEKGPLFTGPTTPLQRIIALIFGFACASISIWGYLDSGRFILILPILAIALIGYGIGIRGFLDQLQQPGVAEAEYRAVADPRKRKRYYIRIGLLLLGAFLLGLGLFVELLPIAILGGIVFILSFSTSVVFWLEKKLGRNGG